MLKTKLSFFVIFYLIILMMAGLFTIIGCSNGNHFISEPEPPVQEEPEQPSSPTEPEFTEVPEESRFKMSLCEIQSFEGEKLGSNPAFATPAPFDMICFSMTAKGANQYQSYGCYDSIVWSSPSLPDTFRVLENRPGYSHTIHQWSNYFYEEGVHTVFLKGYRKGKVVHSDSLTFELKDRDFLCFDWSEYVVRPYNGGVHGLPNELDKNSYYRFRHPIEIDGSNILDILIQYRDSYKGPVDPTRYKDQLEELMGRHLGDPVEYDEAEIRKLFKSIPAEYPLCNLYENQTTRAIIVHQLPDEDGWKDDEYYIHVESK